VSSSTTAVLEPPPEVEPYAIPEEYKPYRDSFSLWMEERGVVQIREVGLRPFSDTIWPFQKGLAETFQTDPRIVVLKARQLGVSTIAMHFAYWLCRFGEPNSQHILILSKSKEDAAYLLEKVPVINDAQPDNLRLDTLTDRTFMYQLSNGNTIECLASTESGGRSRAATAVILDEHAFHRYDTKNWTSLKPTLEGAGHFIVLSTANGQANLFYDLYQQAKQDESEFTAVFLPYDLPPHRDDDWYEREKLGYIGREEEFVQEYPRSDTEAFAKTGTCPFDAEWIGEQIRLSDESPPTQVLHEGRGRIWESPLPGMLYGAGLDCAQGLSDQGNPDYTSLKICTPRGKHVASYEVKAKVEPGQVAQEIYELLKMYNPFLVVERNGAGAGMIAALQALGFRNFYRYEKRHVLPEAPEEKSPRVGIQMTPIIKARVVGNLSAQVNAHALYSRDGSMWREFPAFVQKSPQRWGATGSAKDDQVIAMGWAQWALQYMPRRRARKARKVRWV